MFPPPRNGGGDEERGVAGCGADCGGEEPPVRRLQERDWGSQGELEDHLLHRAEGGAQGQRGQAGDDPDLQGPGGAAVDLLMAISSTGSGERESVNAMQYGQFGECLIPSEIVLVVLRWYLP